MDIVEIEPDILDIDTLDLNMDDDINDKPPNKS